MTLGGGIFLAVLVLGVALTIVTYNRLVGLNQRSQEAWSDIDVQLKRRADLVPNVVETVKGYASHERGVFEEVARWRSAAGTARSTEQRAEAEGGLTAALRQLFAVAEAYPELRANQNFLGLQSQLGEIEETVQNSRRYYNAVARDLNTAIESFPSNLVAGLTGFRKRGFFEPEGPEDRQVPRVAFER